MGYERNYSICVSARNVKQLNDAHLKAKEFFKDLVTEIVPYSINSGGSFFIAPSGSNEGWPTANIHHDYRTFFKFWLRSEFDGGVGFCELYFYDDEGQCEILDYN